jgi:hypothetical protein
MKYPPLTLDQFIDILLDFQRRGGGDLPVSFNADERYAVDRVIVHANPEGWPYVEIYGDKPFDDGRPRPVPTPAEEKLLGEISHTLTKNSPFLDILTSGRFPEKAGEEKREGTC